MNRLRKTDSRRGGKTRPPTVCAGGNTEPAAGSANNRAQDVPNAHPQDAGTRAPVSGWWQSPSEGLYPPEGFSNFLQSNPFAFHPNGSENFHFVGAGVSQSTVPPFDLNGNERAFGG